MTHYSLGKIFQNYILILQKQYFKSHNMQIIYMSVYHICQFSKHLGWHTKVNNVHKTIWTKLQAKKKA